MQPITSKSSSGAADWQLDAAISRYKRPRYLQFMRSEELPRSTTGKLQRHELARLPLTADQRVG